MPGAVTEFLHFFLCSFSLLLALIFGIWFIVSERNKSNGYSLVFLMALVMALECVDLYALSVPHAFVPARAVLVAIEIFMPLALALYCFSYIGKPALKNSNIFQKLVLAASCAFPVLAFLSDYRNWVFVTPDFRVERLLFLTGTGFGFYSALVFMLIAGLACLEQLYMGMDKPRRWKFRIEIMGVGLWIVVEVIYFGQALLYRTLDLNLLWPRSMAVLIGIILIAYSRWNRGTPSQVQLSKNVAYKSLLTILLGCYFIGLALIGEGMRYMSGRGGGSIGLALAILLGVVGVLVFLSERARRRAKVFLYKNFYRHKYDYRQQWMQLTTRLAAETDIEGFEYGILEYFCDTFGIEGAALFVRDKESGSFDCVCVRELMLLGHEIARDNRLVEYLAAKDWIFDSKDNEVGIMNANPALFEQSHIRFVTPLYGAKKELMGFIALKHPIDPSETFIYEDYDLMRILSRQVGASLYNLDLSRQLSTAHKMEAMGRISAFVMHDLKNLVSNLALVVDNAKDYIKDEEFQKDMLVTLSSTVRNMTGLIARLETLRETVQLSPKAVDLMAVAKEVCAMLPPKSCVSLGSSVEAMADWEEINRVVLNLVLNAIEATESGAPVSIEVGREHMPYIRVRDKGRGMSAQFIAKRLFKPFDSTKKKGFGIGLYQCKKIVEAHGGSILVESREGEGSCFSVFLPAADVA